jgi:excisionase family DNA binding protein
MTDQELYLTTVEVALRMGVSTSRVRQLVNEGKLPATRVGDRYRGYWKIDPEKLEIFLLTRRGRGRYSK